MAAIDEAIRIAREAHTPVEIWHLKAAGKRNWGRMPEVVARIEAARKDGVDITADTYAYPAWFNSFSAFIPPWAHEGGDDKMLARLKDPATRERIRKEMEDTGARRLGQRMAGDPRPRGDPPLASSRTPPSCRSRGRPWPRWRRRAARTRSTPSSTS